MKIRSNSLTVFILLLLFCSVFEVNSQVVRDAPPTDQISSAQIGIDELRELYKKRDFESGYEIGRKLSEKIPDNLELQAWFILNMSRNEMSKEAVEAAKKLVEKNQENAWAWFALAHSHIRHSQVKEAASAAEKALRLAPDDEEFIFLSGLSLMMEEKYDEVYALLDKKSSKIKDQSRLLAVKAETQNRQATGGKLDEAKKKQSYESFAKAIELNPNSVNANYVYGLYLNYDKRHAEALPLLKKAVALSPKAAHIRQQYWQAILKGQPAKTEQQRNAEVAADMDNLLRARPDSPAALDIVAKMFGDLGMNGKQKFYEALLVKKFPASSQAEWLSVNAYRAFTRSNTEEGKFKNEKLKSRYVQMVRAFINRPQHVREDLLGGAYFDLFLQVKDDSKISDKEMLELVENTVKYEKNNPHVVYPQGALVLADRKMFREAEKIARKGFEAGKAQVDSQRSFYKEEKEYQEGLNWMMSLMHDALGWIFFKENRFDEAERELLQAVKINDKNAAVFNHLGQLYEAKKDNEKAEDAYINAYSHYFGKENPNSAALKSLYQKRGGKADGFDAYFERVKTIERERRKERILFAKIKEPKNVIPFNLKNLEAKPLPFADLKNKIVVVNIWGTWCGPCVMEMPEFQELHKKYLNDKDVAILTINNDQDLETIKKFMTGKKYDFAVLRDENYLQTVSINAFPTTWFIDREGKISFVKIGSSDKLLEEFSWRIEELRKQNDAK